MNVLQMAVEVRLAFSRVNAVRTSKLLFHPAVVLNVLGEGGFVFVTFATLSALKTVI